MASVQGAQDVLRCDCCEGTKRLAKFYCKTCLINACKECVDLHTASHPSKNHEIVMCSSRNLSYIQPNCKTHVNQKCDFYCYLCNIPICKKCITSTHELHKVMDITEKCKFQHDSIKRDTNDIKHFIIPAYKNLDALTQGKLDEILQGYETLEEKIARQGDVWHYLVDKVVQQYMKEIRGMKEHDLSIIKHQQKDVTHKLSFLASVVNENNKITNSNEAENLITYKSSIKELLKVPAQISPNLPTFEESSISEKRLYEEFGSLITENLSVQLAAFTIKVPTDQPQIISIETKYTDLWQICCLGTNKIWVCGNDKNVQQMDIVKGTILEKVPTNSFPVDLTMTKDGELLFFEEGSSMIKVIKKGKIRIQILLLGWNPLGICSTQSGNILVSMNNKGHNYSRLVRYEGSKIKQIIDQDSDGNILFSKFILFLTENKNGNICVSDVGAKAVIVCDQNNKMKFKYCGDLNQKRIKTFCPRSIATDSQCQILVTDVENDIIHVIDQIGKFVCFIENCGLNGIRSISVDEEDKLWCGEVKGKVKVIKYWRQE